MPTTTTSPWRTISASLLLIILSIDSVASFVAPTSRPRIATLVGGGGGGGGSSIATTTTTTTTIAIKSSADDDDDDDNVRRQRRRPRRPTKGGGASSRTTIKFEEDEYEYDYEPSSFSSSLSSSSSSPSPLRRLVDNHDDDIVAVIIDAENVRGKTGFELDHGDLLDRMLVWTQMRRDFAFGRTIAVIDHGGRSGAHLLRYGGGYGDGYRRRRHAEGGGGGDAGPGLCVSFAGPRIKADDVIARDVRWLLSSSPTTSSSSSSSPPSSTPSSQPHPSSSSSSSHERRPRRRRVVVVVTADRELAWRCRCAAASAGRIISHRSATIENYGGNVPNDDPIVLAARERCGGRKKKSRAARMRQFAEQRTEEEEEEEEGLGGRVSSTSIGDADVRIDATSTGSDAFVAIEDSEPSVALAGGIPTVEVISPQVFLEDLDHAVHEWLRRREPRHVADRDDAITTATTATKTTTMTTTISEDHATTAIPSPVTTTQDLFRLRGRMLTLESSLRDKISLHRRGTTMGELRKCKVEWRRVLSSIVDDGDRDVEGRSLVSSLAWSLSSTISSLDEDDGYIGDPTLSPLPSTMAVGATSSWERLAPKDQERLLLQWGKEGPRGQRRQNAARREKTEDRVVLAERLRRQLELIFDRTGEVEGSRDADGGIEASLVDAYAAYINNACSSDV